MDKTSNTGLEHLPYRFTAKELDEETGLYYCGVRLKDAIPIVPSFVDIDANIERARTMTPIQFYYAVKNKGEWATVVSEFLFQQLILPAYSTTASKTI